MKRRPWDTPGEQTPLLGASSDQTLKRGSNSTARGKSPRSRWFQGSSSKQRPERTASGSVATVGTQKPKWVYYYGIALLAHFLSMGVYDLFLVYQAYRSSFSKSCPPVWIFLEGRVYNPYFGPGPLTLDTFGVFNPALIMREQRLWTVGLSLTMSCSVVQLVWHLLVLWIVAPYCCGGWIYMGIGLASALSGGLWCVVWNCVQDTASVPETTGLACAALSGTLGGVLMEHALVCCGRASRHYHNWGEAPGLRRTRWGGICAALAVQVASAWVLPYTSPAAVLGGSVMGLCCAVFLFTSHLHQNRQLLEFKFDEEKGYAKAPILVTTPPRRRGGVANGDAAYEHSFPPTTTSKVGATPLMRRSILTSPDEEDEEVEAMGYLSNKKPELHRYNHHGDVSYLHNNATFPIETTLEGDLRKLVRRSPSVLRIVRLLGLGGALITVAVPTFLLGSGAVLPPSYEALSDSLYGCKTLRCLYSMNDATMEYTSTQSSAISSTDEWVCSEVCVPISLIQQSLQEIVTLTSGSCSNLGYQCLILVDAMEIGSGYKVQSMIYERWQSDGSCSNSSFYTNGANEEN